ncbi:MAG: hypothetical protein M3251_06365 [Thermoproteota archaeon]|nr:hypothetical protein [Thermoproteota archaeon]
MIKGINNQFERLSSELTTTSTSRPTGVIVIAILNIIGGIIMLIIGPPLAFAGTIIPFVVQSIPEQQQQSMTSSDGDLSQVSSSLVGASILALAWIMMAVGIFSFVVAYGLLKVRSSAWKLTVILSIISIAVNAISIARGNTIGIVNIIISGIILYYLYRPHVRAYFAKSLTEAS